MDSDTTGRFAAQIRHVLDAKGMTVSGATLKAGLPHRALYNVLDGHLPSLDRAEEICQALGLEFYIGPPRAPDVLYYGAANTEHPANPPTHAARDRALRERISARAEELRGTAQTLNQLADEVMLASESPEPATAEIIEFPVAATTDDDELYRVAEGSPAYKSINDPTPDIPATRPVNVMEIAAAAGGGSEATSERVVGCVWFRRDWLDRHAIDSTQCAVISVQGHSMNPTLPPGCSILVDRQRQRRRAGRIFVLRTADGLIAKRLRHDPSSGWELVSDNPSPNWPTLPWPAGAEVVGEVVWAARTLLEEAVGSEEEE